MGIIKKSGRRRRLYHEPGPLRTRSGVRAEAQVAATEAVRSCEHDRRYRTWRWTCKDFPQPFARLATQLAAPHCATRGSPLPIAQLLARKQRRAETASTRLAHKDCPQPFAKLAAQIVAPHCATRGSPQPIAQLLARNAPSGQTIERKAQWSGSARRLSKRAKVERGRLPSRALALDTVASPHIRPHLVDFDGRRATA